MQFSDDNLGLATESDVLRGAELRVHVAMLRNGDRLVRAAAAKALGRLGDAGAIAPLMDALQDGEAEVRFAAAWVLWQLADGRAVEPLCAALWDSVSEVRSAAAFALGRIGDVRAVGPLCAMVKGSEQTVRFPAATALWQIGNVKVLPERILAAETLTVAQKLSVLDELSGVVYRFGGQKESGQVICYPFGSVWVLCEKLCRRHDTEAWVREGAEAVLAEMRNRAEGRILLRGSERNGRSEKRELLRGVSGEVRAEPSEQLLRPGEIPFARMSVRKPGLLARLFGRR